MLTITRKLATYAALIATAAVVQAAFLGCCLVSRECRQIRRDLIATQNCIDPLHPILDRLEALHLELFGDE